MTTQDRATAASVGSRLPPAFYIPDGDEFVPTALARGPWGQTISGMVTGGILGHVIERDVGDPDFQPARLTVDLLDRRPWLRYGSRQPSPAREGGCGWPTPW